MYLGGEEGLAMTDVTTAVGQPDFIAVQCTTVQYSSIQCSTVLCIAVGCSEVGCSAVQCSAGLPPKYTPLYTPGWPALIALFPLRSHCCGQGWSTQSPGEGVK